jgi:pyridoxal 5'-phosphate synthase pdxT subunit
LQIGVLAIQGGFSKHKNSLRKLDINPLEVKYENQLHDCDGLIIPGGESTTISKLLIKYNLINPIKEFSKRKPIFGTCAGLILMSRNSNDSRVKNLNILDVEIERNGWGRQISSFSQMIKVKQNCDDEIKAIFIRAPKIKNIGSEVEVLSEIKGEPILIKQGIHFGATFHPELTEDTTIHKLFIESIAA